MSFRQNNNERRENHSDDETGFCWRDVFAAGAALVAGIYTFSQMFNRSSENERVIPSSSTTYETQRIFEEQDSYTRQGQPRNSVGNKDRIIIVIDATPEKCGGFIIFPKDEKIKYYSTTWSPYYKFPSMDGEPDKFEMLNALVALSEFEYVIRKNMDDYEGLTIKTDSIFCQSTYIRDEHSNLKEYIEEKKEELNGEWEKVTRKEDIDMKIADRLSRNENYIEVMHMEYPGYALKKVSVNDTLSMIKDICVIPLKYHL